VQVLRKRELPVISWCVVRVRRNHLKVAGATHRVFEDEALEQVYHATKGVPRKINLRCTHALLSGAAENRKVVGPAIIKRVLNDFDGTL